MKKQQHRPADGLVQAHALPLLTLAVALSPAAALAAQLPDDLATATGEAIYQASCANCHGADGRGTDPALLAFEEEVPDFTDCDFAARVMDYIRTMCTDDAWPRGELNLPRPLFTEKAYSFLQGQTGARAPLYDGGALRAYGRLVLGRSFASGAWGRSWTPMVEFIANRALGSELT